MTPENFAYVANVKYRSGAVGIFDWNCLEATYFCNIAESLEVVGIESLS